MVTIVTKILQYNQTFSVQSVKPGCTGAILTALPIAQKYNRYSKLDKTDHTLVQLENANCPLMYSTETDYIIALLQ